jgi:hypothetical protein
MIGVRGGIVGLEYVPHYPLSLRHGGEKPAFSKEQCGSDLFE